MSSRIKIADAAGGSNVMRLQMSSGPDCRCLVDLGKNPTLNSIPRTMETFPGSPVVKHPPAVRETAQIPSLRWVNPLEKEVAACSSILA